MSDHDLKCNVCETTWNPLAETHSCIASLRVRDRLTDVEARLEDIEKHLDDFNGYAALPRKPEGHDTPGNSLSEKGK